MAHDPRAVVLAAGQGTRMRSNLPKVLHTLAGRPLLMHTVDVAAQATGHRPLVVVNPDHQGVVEMLAGVADVAVQPDPRGTGDALRSVPPSQRGDGPLLVISADVPLLRAATAARLLEQHTQSGAACTLLTVAAPDPGGLGRVVRDALGRITAIVEERDLPAGVEAPGECNAGVYVFEGHRLWPVLDRLTNDNAQGEYYLTDVVAALAGDVDAVVLSDPAEAIGINDRRQLAAAEAVVRRRIVEELMLDGVTVEDPGTTYVDAGVRVGRDSVIRPMTVLRGTTILGEDCEVGPMAQLRDVRAGDRVRIGASHLEGCSLADDVVIGQYNRVRPGSELGEHVELGTHAEVKNSRVGRHSRISHFSCLLDSEVGADVNYSAGAVTCNYDGVDKHTTLIEDGVFVGSDSMLVAPLRIGEGAYIAAGSVITRDVPAGALAVERSEQQLVQDWARRRRGAAAARAAGGGTSANESVDGSGAPR